VSHEHELSIEALERISHRLDVYKTNETKRHEETLRWIEIKKLFRDSSGSNEISPSNMDNNNIPFNDYVNEVSKIVFLYHNFISNLLFFKHYNVDMTCIFVVLT
jgi:hypothetical protein